MLNSDSSLDAQNFAGWFTFREKNSVGFLSTFLCYQEIYLKNTVVFRAYRFDGPEDRDPERFLICFLQALTCQFSFHRSSFPYTSKQSR
jgi:hypothetical protein